MVKKVVHGTLLDIWKHENMKSKSPIHQPISLAKTGETSSKASYNYHFTVLVKLDGRNDKWLFIA